MAESSEKSYITLDQTALTSLPSFSDDISEEIAKSFKSLIATYDGPDSFDAAQVAYGYIDSHERLIVPQYLYDRLPTALPDAKYIMEGVGIIHLLPMIAANTMRLKMSQMKESHAVCLATIRARLTVLGYLLKTKEARLMRIDEVDILKEATEKKISAFTKDVTQCTPDILRDIHTSLVSKHKEGKTLGVLDTLMVTGISLYAKYAKEIRMMSYNAETIIAFSYLLFRQLGHHYQIEYEDKYDKLKLASKLDFPVDCPSNAALFRTAVHPFGFRAAAYLIHLREDCLPGTVKKRLDVAPNGMAILKTTWAAFSALQSFPIANEFYRLYSNQISQLGTLMIEYDNMTSYNQLALHNFARFFFTEDELKSKPEGFNVKLAEDLAPIAKGIIDAMGSNTALSKQKVLDKHADNNPLIVQAVTAVITGTLDVINNEASFSAPDHAKITSLTRAGIPFNQAVKMIDNEKSIAEVKKPVVKEVTPTTGDDAA